MIKQMMFLRWAKAKRLPVIKEGKLSEYGKRVFRYWDLRNK